ncbi:unnamed protein product [Polarella glacialis]|uniref:Uncharacterized protein n=1 Tax=Polarella glacialis TaxID=89957 RepID=A0A813J6T5_POLGL|nr:unnamed protein product [Polarella glacialis]
MPAAAPSACPWLDRPLRVPGFGDRFLPMWQVALGVLALGSLWLNAIWPYLAAWLLVGWWPPGHGLRGAALWRNLRWQGRPQQQQASKDLATALQSHLDASYKVAEVEFVGWRAAGAILISSLFLGPWVIGWAVLLSIGAWAWASREQLTELGQGLLQHAKGEVQQAGSSSNANARRPRS